jgi:cytochrome c biogenesis protein CcdA/thiol-disulfide isomerase/thioredoxin
MENIFIDTALAFIEGIGLIASPCILPILPIFLSSSLEGSKKRPYGIIFGFVFTFAVFTYFSRKLVQYSGIDLNIIRHASFVLLGILGLVMISSYLSEKFSFLTRRFSNVGASSSALNNPQGGFGSGLLFGGLIALIWTPCAGPILAAVIVQTVLQKTSLGSFLVLISFAIGAGIPMLLIAIFGRFLMAKLGFLKNHSNALRKILGVIILASVGLMAYQDSYSTNTFSSATKTGDTFQTALINPTTPYPAPPLTGIVGWINSPPLELSQLKGKVVLIDFWTYSCINCMRTLPYLNSWYTKYHDKGLVIIGVHTPEFDFEKNADNVKKAVEKYGIKYPVALDSNFGAWQSFNNSYWPAHYLINKEGNVVYQHFGEGEYDVTENNIRFLLGLNKVSADTASSDDMANMFHNLTPETYLGYERAANYKSPQNILQNAEASYTFPKVLPDNGWGLEGKWIVDDKFIVSASNEAAVKLRFNAKHVYIVMGNPHDKPIKVKLLLNGEEVVDDQGKDVQNGEVMVNGHALYDVLSFKSSESGVLEIMASEPGLEVYTFTFGG